MNENEIGKIVVDRAVKLHMTLGPGLFESVYETVLMDELERAGLRMVRQADIPIIYGGRRFEAGFRADLIVEDMVILELKSVERVSAAHRKQLLTYLRLTGKKLGFLLNFGEAVMKDGITRTINGIIET